jgi:hypothetical protein
MREIKYKILMFNGELVDETKLHDGIYIKSISPTLYSKEETIESLIERTKWMKDASGINFFSDEYFDNLSQCELVDVTLTINI